MFFVRIYVKQLKRVSWIFVRYFVFYVKKISEHINYKLGYNLDLKILSLHT